MMHRSFTYWREKKKNMIFYTAVLRKLEPGVSSLWFPGPKTVLCILQLPSQHLLNRGIFKKRDFLKHHSFLLLSQPLSGSFSQLPRAVTQRIVTKSEQSNRVSTYRIHFFILLRMWSKLWCVTTEKVTTLFLKNSSITDELWNVFSWPQLTNSKR